MNNPISWVDMLRTARAAVAIVLLLGVPFLLVPQMRDMLAEISDYGANAWPGISFHIALFVLALAIWFWSEAVLTARFAKQLAAAGGQPINAQVFAVMPRYLFLTIALMGFVAAIRSSDWLDAAVIVVWAASFDAFLLGRLTRRHAQIAATNAKLLILSKQQEANAAAGWAGVLPGLWGSVRSVLIAAPAPKLSGILLILATAAFFFSGLGSFWPEALAWSDWPFYVGGFWRGPAAALFCLALVIGPLTVVTYAADLWKIKFLFFGTQVKFNRPPVVAALAALIVFTPQIVELHAVRVIPINKQVLKPQDRIALGVYYDEWAAKCGRTASGPARPIIVAISGGASRAALWGASVLTKIDTAAAGHGAIFAVSSVSGGSVGAAAYVSMLAGQNGNGCTLTELGAGQKATRDAAVRDALAADALGPVLAGSIIGDIPRAVFGVPAKAALWLRHKIHKPLAEEDEHFRGGDRAEALERSFEKNWRSATGTIGKLNKETPVSFERPYLSLFYPRASGSGGSASRSTIPIWIANGTDDQSGDRILTTPFKIDDASIFPAAQDALAQLTVDVPISTAIHNTARFPYLSPAGELAPWHSVPGGPPPAQIVDGGYFENNGLQTALELARWLKRYGGPNVQPIIVQVTADADTDIQEKRIVRCGKYQDDPALSLGSDRPSQLLVPLVGVYSVRGGHSHVVLREAAKEFCGSPSDPASQSFFQFYLYRPDSSDVPLNWVISSSMGKYIWTDAFEQCGNTDEYDRLTKVLATVVPVAK